MPPRKLRHRCAQIHPYW